MCNDYEQHIRWKQYCDMMQALNLHPNAADGARPAVADDIKINDIGPIMRAARATALNLLL